MNKTIENSTLQKNIEKGRNNENRTLTLACGGSNPPTPARKRSSKDGLFIYKKQIQCRHFNKKGLKYIY